MDRRKNHRQLRMDDGQGRVTGRLCFLLTTVVQGAVLEVQHTDGFLPNATFWPGEKSH